MFAFLWCFVYIIGVPFAFFNLLYSAYQDNLLFDHRPDKPRDENGQPTAANPQTQERLGALYDRYKHTCWWFEIFDMIRGLVSGTDGCRRR